MNHPLEDAEFKLLSDLLTQRYGLVFEGVRREILRSKIEPRLRQLHLERLLDYYHYLLHHPEREREFQELRLLVTNNETYFFRESHQFDLLVQRVVAERRSELIGRPLQLLSAGCSSGEEPYTIVIALQQAGLEIRGITWAIDACDLNQARIDQARAARYGLSSLRAADAEAKRRYFDQRDGHFFLRPRHKQGVRLFEANLVAPGTGADWGPYDAIFCRNVLIYLSDDAFHRVVDLFHAKLRPNGILFLGHSESLIGKRNDFVPELMDGSVVYRRSEGPR